MSMPDYYSVYADYGDGDDRNHEYPIGTLAEAHKFAQDVLNDPDATLKKVGYLRMVIRDIRGKTVSIYYVTRP